ncbi:MAG: integrase arm-type DNA-binding domain-containing protein, partial [Gammaproteobacteria bacterium]|nr:integrase arm-type DNA-binding domain-containing protein [Gammaproteobacteria bacterium]
MKLTDSAIRNSRPTEKPMKLIDGRGLFLLVAPSGGKWWRFRYRFEGKHKLLSLGTYPAVTLKDARVKRDEMRRLLAAGIDPGQARKAEKAARGDANSFEAVAREWIGKYAPTWAESHASKIIRRLERDVFPWIGARPVGHITAPELLAVVRRIEQRGALETAHRALRNSGQVFRYAVATGRAERDPAADLRGALPPVKAKHLAAITDPEAVGALLRAIAGYQGSLVTRCALRLA